MVNPNKAIGDTASNPALLAQEHERLLLKIELLKEMVKLTEQQTGIPLRKKLGYNSDDV